MVQLVTVHVRFAHDSVAVSVGHGLPVLANGVTIVRVRVRDPVRSTHLLHGLHALTTQSQGVTAHDSDSEVLKHGVPPYFAGVTTVRVRVRTPDVEEAQVDHAVQEDMTQFTGSQAAVSVKFGHAVPP